MVDTAHSTLTGADLHDPKVHETSHESGGGDELDFDQLAEGTTYKKFLATERTKLTDAFLKDGSVPMTGDLNMGAYNIVDADRILAATGENLELVTQNGTTGLRFEDSTIYTSRHLYPTSHEYFNIGGPAAEFNIIRCKTLHGALAASEITGELSIVNGGSGQTTQQAAIDALTAVAGGTNEHVLTKDAVSGNAIWKVGGGVGDMLKATYDPNDDGVIAVAQTEATKYPDTGEQAFLDADHTKLNGIETAADVTDSTNVSSAGALMKSGGTMTADLNMGAFDLTHVDRIMSDPAEELGLHSKNGTVALSIENSIIYSSRDIYPITTGTKNLGGPANHWNIITADNLKGDLAATYITGTLAVANGGTGVTGDTYDAKYVDGCSPGTTDGDVYKIASATTGSVLWHNSTTIDYLTPGTNGYQLTTQGAGNPVVWAASSDLIWSDTHCYICGEEFKDGEELALQIREHNEVGDILTVPVHIKCTDVYKVLEDRISELEDK